MRALWAVALAAILATLPGTAVLRDLISEEIRGRLYRLPYALIRLAVRRVPPDVHEDLAEEWTAELYEILRGAEALPVTQLYRGIRYGLGLLWAASSTGRDLSTSTATPGAADDRAMEVAIAIAGVVGAVAGGATAVGSPSVGEALAVGVVGGLFIGTIALAVSGGVAVLYMASREVRLGGWKQKWTPDH